MATRGIIGRKPIVGSTSTYSDVFGPTTQFVQNTTGSWPSSTGSAGFILPITTPESWRYYTKSSDGAYRSIGGSSTYPDTNACSDVTATPGATYICTSSLGASLVLIYKKVTGNYTPYQYIGSIEANTTNTNALVQTISFNPAGNVLIVCVKKSSTTVDAAQTFQYWIRNGDSFSYGGGLGPTSTSSNVGLPYQVSWNADGTSVAFGIGITLYVFNYSGGTFTSLTVPQQAGATYRIFATAWSPNGDLVVYGSYNGETIYLYKRSGDTFTSSVIHTVDSVTYAGGGRYLEFTPDGSMLLAVTRGGAVALSRIGDTFTSVSTPDVSSFNTTAIYGFRSLHAISDTEIIAVNDFAIWVWKRSGNTISFINDRITWPETTARWSNESTAYYQGQPRGTNPSTATNTTFAGSIRPGWKVKW